MRQGSSGPILALAVLLAAAGTQTGAQAPLSAIDWLNEAETEAEMGVLLPLTPPSAADSPISVRPLEAVRAEAVGLYPAARVGLPRDLWGPSTGAELGALIAALPLDTLPALRELAYRLLLAELDPPAPSPGSDPEGFIAARLEALIRMGALDQAGALLDALNPDSPRLAALKFDLRLLLGDDEAACAGLARVVQTGGAPVAASGSLPAAAVFCQARGGDWAGAERSLREVRAGQAALGADYLDLLERFVDVDSAAEAAQGSPLPPNPSPLAWRLLEALGEPVATQGLPLAFAHADLRGTAGWRAQIEAAERLVRAGALPPNRLIGLYTERRAAASGGIWERVRRVQSLDAALATGQPGPIGAALRAAWPQVQEGELEVAFANLFARPLMGAGLQGPEAELATLVGLLSDDYELAALGVDPARAPPRLVRLAAVARGLPPPGARAAGGDAEAAVLAVFAAREALPEAVAERLAEGRMGEELLRALIRIGGSNDPRMLAEGLALLRQVGLEDIARRAALQALLLDRRG